ncbi:STY0301 family protein [Duganella sp. CF517]|uniref:STY0301 family protein n=1 Tax=Duganella sp. CF517 TaxID=1881038 RepID=UPI000B7CEFD5|nr:STY0301 family protein [Duganella sp. CF517]
MLLALAGPVGAAPLALQCPAKYPDLDQMRTLAERGWTAPFPGTPHAPLVQVGVSVGPAERNGELIGAPLRGGAGYRFEYDVVREDLEKWAFCEYSMPLGYVRIMYRISTGGRACEMRLKERRGRLIAASIWCD